MAVYKNLWTGLKQLYAPVEYDKTIVMPNASGTVTLGTSTQTLTNKTLTTPTINSPVITAPNGATSTGIVIAKKVMFQQLSGGTTYTGSVPIPAGATLLDIQVAVTVLWEGATAVMDVGDAADPNGYFAAINVKATDLLVGEVLSIMHADMWGGKEGAYLVAATGRRGLVTPAGSSGNYYSAAETISGIITVGTPSTFVAGRAVMTVLYTVADAIAQVKA